ncbi:hypothetical protein ACFX1Z_018092 [Malus domestica]
MKKEEVDIVLPLFDGVAETGKIKRKALKNLLVNVYLESKSLARSLNDIKTAIEKLKRLASGVLLLYWLVNPSATSTTVETTVALKARINEYLDSNTQHWLPGHSVVVKDIEDVNRMKMALYVTHTINFQNYGDKTNRRSDLVLELKKILEDLGIKYHLLPQEVHLRYVRSSTAELPPTWR